MIELKNVNKTFIKDGKEIHAVQDVNLSIDEQDIFGIIGFSGAGKSTLVRCINLLEQPDTGAQVIFDGVDLTKLKSKKLREIRSKISMIFQNFNLMPSRTVLENVLYPLSYKGIPKSEQVDKAMHLLNMVGLDSKSRNYPSELSGGQKQRVAIARALASDPKVLLCDEATSALDPKTTKEILTLIKELNEKLKLTVVIITHEMDVVKEICNKVAIMEQGRIVEYGDIFSIFSNPKKKISYNFVHTASVLSKIDKILETYPDILQLKENEVLVRLTYTGKGTSDPLISSMSNKYNLTINILFADVELVHGSPIGGTVCIISGEPENITGALDEIRSKRVKVEELHHE